MLAAGSFPGPGRSDPPVGAFCAIADSLRSHADSAVLRELVASVREGAVRAVEARLHEVTALADRLVRA